MEALTPRLYFGPVTPGTKQPENTFSYTDYERGGTTAGDAILSASVTQPPPMAL